MKYSNPFTYLVPASTIPAGSSIMPAINIDNMHDFQLEEIRFSPVTDPGDVLCKFSYSSGESFSNASFDTSLYAQGANNFGKLVFTEPFIIPKNTQIDVLLENTTGAPITLFEVHLIGRKI